MSPEVTLRACLETDEGFIYSSWLQSFRDSHILKIKGPPATHLTTGVALYTRDAYYRNQRDVINAVIKASKVLIAANPEEQDQIYGYIVYRDLSADLRIISYVYVKQPFRRMGIGRKLFEAAQPAHVCTHGSPSTRRLIDRLALVYDPFMDIALIQKEKEA